MSWRACAAFTILALSAGVFAFSSASGSAPSPCRASQLTGSFTAIRGSAGAGSITYALRLRNKSAQVCFVSGLPGLRLEDRSGRRLPTHVSPAHRGEGTAALIILHTNASAWASARFSPDVPGPGEPVARQCERTAHKVSVRVPPSHEALVVAMRPPTPVCEHGAMLLSLFSSKRPRA